MTTLAQARRQLADVQQIIAAAEAAGLAENDEIIDGLLGGADAAIVRLADAIDQKK